MRKNEEKLVLVKFNFDIEVEDIDHENLTNGKVFVVASGIHTAEALS